MKKANISLLVLSLISLLSFSGCNEKISSSTSSISSSSSSSTINEITYQLIVKSINNKTLKDVKVEIYEDTKLINTLTTDYYGKVEITLPKSNYSAKVSNLPKGMYFDNEVALLENEETVINCLARPIDESLPGNKFYNIGDIMYDFTITTSDSKKVNLASTLEEKKGVIINFWSTDCEPCKDEFPLFEETYQTYKNDIEIIALSVEDTLDEVQEFKEVYELSFPMGRDINRLLLWSFIRFFGDVNTGSYSVPGTVFVDKYGFIHKARSFSYISLEEVNSDFEELINKYQ